LLNKRCTRHESKADCLPGKELQCWPR